MATNERITGKDDGNAGLNPRMDRFIAGIWEILRKSQESAFRCFGSDAIVIRPGGRVTYSEEEPLKVNTAKPRNNSNLS